MQLCLSLCIRIKCRPPHNLRFQSKCRAPPSCLSSPSRSSCSTCPSSTSTACPLSWPLAQPNSARSSLMLRPTPRLFCALCATLGLRGILSPSFRRVLHFVTTVERQYHTLCAGLNVCQRVCLPLCCPPYSPLSAVAVASSAAARLSQPSSPDTVTEFTHTISVAQNIADESFMRDVFNRHADCNSNQALSAPALMAALKEVEAPVLHSSGSTEENLLRRADTNLSGAVDFEECENPCLGICEKL